jgi:hypothetical protein
MEDQIPASQVPSSVPAEPPAAPQVPDGRISAQDLELLKARARELAIQQTLLQQQQQQVIPQAPAQTPRIIYVRRNFTVAELLLILLLSCGLVTAAQAIWGFASSALPKVEIKIK